MMTVKVALAATYDPSGRLKVKLVLDESLIKIDLIIQTENFIQLFERLRQAYPDVVVIDVNIAEMECLESVATLRLRYPNVKVIVLIDNEDESTVAGISALGIKSIVRKNDVHELLRAIRIVYDGGMYFPDNVGHLLQSFLSKHRSSDIKQTFKESELQVMQGICKGLSSTKIGSLLNKSPRTIEDYRNQVYEKLGVRTKEELIVKVVKLKLVEI